MTRINTNVASLRGLRNLQRANSLLDTSLTRLSTGLKINSGRDNPSGLIASETLRSQITTIEQSIKNSNRANNVISTVDSALGEISGLLNQIRGLVQEGLNDGALSQTEIEANQQQIDAALSAINRIAANTTFAGDKLIDGSKAFRTTLTTADAAKLDDFKINEALFAGSSTIEITATVDTAATRGVLQYKGGDLTSALTLEVSGAKGTDVLFLGASSTVANIKTAINGVKDVTGVLATITANAVADKVTINSGGGNDSITISDARATAGTGVFDGDVTIALAAAANANDPTDVTGVTVDANTGDVTINIQLGKDAGGSVNATAQDIADAINNANDAEATTARQYIQVDNVDSNASEAFAAGNHTLTGGSNATLELRTTEFGSAKFVGVSALSGTFTTTDTGGNAATRVTGTDIAVTVNGQAAQGKGLTATLNTAQFAAEIAFNEANNVANTSAVITVTGGGSLFQIGQEVSAAGQVGLGIEAVNTARLGGITGKLFELGSGAGKSLLDVGPSVPGSELVDIVEEAINRVATLRGRLGALQKNVIETNVSTLGVALENISEARSQILDTDFAEQTSELTRAQILSQAGLSLLAIANQTPSQVLSLLG